MTARIVILNGIGSAGKTSIAKALQAIADEPFLHVQMDAFLDMLPASCVGHRDGIIFDAICRDGSPVVAIRTGAVADRAFRGMRHAIAAMAAQGNHLIVDDVAMRGGMTEYASLLAAFRVVRVGVFAPLAILEARERQRGDRRIGLARWQYDRVHAGVTYDLELDTSAATPLDCALEIKRRFRL